jgi:regulator of sigma E protease
LTQAALDGRDLSMRVSDQSGGHRRTVSLPLARFQGRDLGLADWRAIGIGVPFSEPVLGEVKPAGPAAVAGLQTGDRVLAVDGQPVLDAGALRERIRASAMLSVPVMQWRIERGAQRLLLVVEPRVIDDNGRRIGRIDAAVGHPPALVTVQMGLWDGLVSGATKTWETSWLSLRMIGRMVTGQSSLRQLSGPLSIAEYAGQSAQQGLAYYLGFLALVSVSLGVLNLLPLPMLDGGHLIYYLYEGATGRPVSDLWLAWLQRGGALVLLLVMSIALSNDVARLLGLQ